MFIRRFCVFIATIFSFFPHYFSQIPLLALFPYSALSLRARAHFVPQRRPPYSPARILFSPFSSHRLSALPPPPPYPFFHTYISFRRGELRILSSSFLSSLLILSLSHACELSLICSLGRSFPLSRGSLLCMRAFLSLSLSASSSSSFDPRFDIYLPFCCQGRLCCQMIGEGTRDKFN